MSHDTKGANGVARKPIRLGIWLVLSGALLAVGAGVVAWQARQSESDERVIARFTRWRNEGDQRALELLGPAPVFDDVPVSEKVAEARQTDHLLRAREMTITAIRRGEPDRSTGKIKPSAGRYTLVTRMQGSAPPIRVRNDRGEVEPPASLFIMHPDLVVEVIDGKIHGLRNTIHID